ncbi:MAG: hypothetical protein H0Z37_08555 [Firmicutes bacterium]|nr:hypothetical protein [Bacillota bacterium]
MQRCAVALAVGFIAGFLAATVRAYPAAPVDYSRVIADSSWVFVGFAVDAGQAGPGAGDPVGDERSVMPQIVLKGPAVSKPVNIRVPGRTLGGVVWNDMPVLVPGAPYIFFLRQSEAGDWIPTEGAAGIRPLAAIRFDPVTGRIGLDVIDEPIVEPLRTLAAERSISVDYRPIDD